MSNKHLSIIFLALAAQCITAYPLQVNPTADAPGTAASKANSACGNTPPSHSHNERKFRNAFLRFRRIPANSAGKRRGSTCEPKPLLASPEQRDTLMSTE
jgi:hypothetical protein